MKAGSVMEPLSRHLPLLVAATLPLGAYSLIPGTVVSLAHLATALLVLVAGIAAYSDRHHRPPFEYWWPAMPMLVLALLGGDSTIATRHALPLIGLFLAIIVTIQHRRRAIDALWIFALACGAGAVLNGLAQIGWIPPSAIDGETQRAVAIASSVEEAALMLVYGGLAALFCLVHVRHNTWQRVATGLALLTMVAWCLSLVPDAAVYRARWSPPTVHQWPAEKIGLWLLTLWIVARIMARSIRQRNHTHTGGLTVLLVLGTVFHAVTGMSPLPTTALLLGLVAAHDAPWANTKKTRVPRWLPWPVAACALLPALGLVSPGPHDPRNQLTRGDRLLQHEDYHALDQTMDFLLARHPDDPAYALLRAKSLLARGWPHAAADQFGSVPPAVDPDPRQRFRQQAFLDRLRDSASARSGAARGFLFERALVHAGDVDSALNSLAFRRASSPPSYSGDRAPVVGALAQLLGDPNLVSRLEDWSAPALRALLVDAGVAIVPLPGESNPHIQFMVFRAARRPDGLQVNVYGAKNAVATYFYPESLHRDPPDRPLAWRSETSGADGPPTISLTAGPAVVAIVRIESGGHTTIERTETPLPAGESIAAAAAVP